jgi:glycosyltransferase involved in cell wall biosynthesis
VRVGVFAPHPAPYRDPTFSEVKRRNNLELVTVNDQSASSYQPYLAESDSEPAEPVLGHKVKSNNGGYETLLGRFDVLFISGYARPAARKLLWDSLRKRIPVVLAADTESNGRRTPVQVAWRACVAPVIRRLAGVLWVPGAAARSYWHSRGFPNDRVFEGAYCLDGETISAQTDTLRPSRAALRQTFGISPDQWVFLFVGRFAPQRGLTYLLSAFAETLKTSSSSVLMMVGDGPLEDDVRQLAGRLRVSHSVRLLPPMPFSELPRAYVAADAYVQPSLYEPYSLATMQAALSRLPIVATNAVGSVYDLNNDGRAMLTVPHSSTEALYSAMRELLDGHCDILAMTKQAHKCALFRSTAWAASQFEQAASVAASLKPTKGYDPAPH